MADFYSAVDSEIVGLVGESGSGKSTIGRALLGLADPTGGLAKFDGLDASLARKRLDMRRRMQLIFQDPYSSLDPRRTIGAQVGDALDIHHLLPKAQRRDRVLELLDLVGLRPELADRRPHQFSGGQRQRIAIARALAAEPDFVVADEPVSALDVSIQAQIIKLFQKLQRQNDLAILFISHDLHVVRHLSDRIVVLYLGRVMESGPAEALFDNPRHPYTKALLSAMPNLNRASDRVILQGDPPSPVAPPSGCVFRTRCPWAMPVCGEAVPPARKADIPGHQFACIRD